MKKRIILIIFSLSFFLVWGMGFLDTPANQVSAALAISYTMLATFFLNKKFKFNLNAFDKALVLSCPIIYFAMFTFVQGQASIFYLINPFLVSLILLFLVLNQISDLTQLNNLFICFFCSSFYIYCFFPYWQNSRIVQLTDNFDSQKKIEKRKKQSLAYDSINLNDYSFINSNLDTVKASSTKEFILIETWNETCYPCIMAFKEMPAFYEENKNRLDYYYIYENSKLSVREEFNKIFNFRHIKTKSKILVDINQNLYLDSKMNGFPYFLLFDKNGNIIFHQQGYSSSYRRELESKIRQHINKK